MSEYQYYEFQTVQRRLTAKEMGELRKYSTRAEITTTRFTNEYTFGDFKGSPNVFMEKYFDGFLYLANWGTRELQLAIPANLFPARTADRYCSEESLSVRATSGKVILKFWLEEDSGGMWTDQPGDLSSLLPIRDELVRGDLRVLYLGWLMDVQSGQRQSKDAEPPVPPNLGKLSAAQACFVDFFAIDPELLAVAAERSSRTMPASSNRPRLASWVDSLPTREKDEMLVRLAEGKASNLAMELQARFHRSQNAEPPAAKAKPRLVGELLAASEKRRQE